jgi:hypothetical protein
MRNNHFFKTQLLLAALAATLLVPVSTFAQQRTATSKTTTIKDSDIYVPEKVLEPSYTKKEAAELLKQYVAAFGDSDMPRTYEAFAKEPEKFKRIGTRQLQAAMGNLYNFVKDPDLQEVTEVSDKWYKDLYNKALELKEPAALMDKAIRLQNASMYAQATRDYAAKFDELKKFADKKGTRIDSATLAKIKESNKAKRKAEYIALRKKEIMEAEEAAKEAVEEELKKQSASKKK